MTDMSGGGAGGDGDTSGSNTGTTGSVGAAGSRSFERQKGTIYDLIAAGEIEGVVGGLSGVYFNDTAITDVDTVKHSTTQTSIAPRHGTCDASSSSTTLSNCVAEDGTTGLFVGLSTSDLSDKPRYIQIKDAGPTSTLAEATTPFVNYIIVSDNNTLQML